MERGQRGRCRRRRRRAVTHPLRGLGPQGLGGQRLALEPPVAAALAQQVRDRRTGGHADVFPKPPSSTRFTSLASDACEATQLPRRRCPSDGFLDEPAAFAVLPVTRGSE